MTQFFTEADHEYRKSLEAKGFEGGFRPDPKALAENIRAHIPSLSLDEAKAKLIELQGDRKVVAMPTSPGVLGALRGGAVKTFENVLPNLGRLLEEGATGTKLEVAGIVLGVAKDAKVPHGLRTAARAYVTQALATLQAIAEGTSKAATHEDSIAAAYLILSAASNDR